VYRLKLKKVAMRKWLSIHRGDEHPTWGAVWIDIGRLRFIRCAVGHPYEWLIGWRRELPEWNRAQWERRHEHAEADMQYLRENFPRLCARVLAGDMTAYAGMIAVKFVKKSSATWRKRPPEHWPWTTKS
jgi:hypothetical protein